MKIRKSKARQGKDRPSARAYHDISPAYPGHSRAKAPPRAYRGDSIGVMATGFDAYGYPLVQEFRLPAPFQLVPARRYGKTPRRARAVIQPMKIATSASVAQRGPSLPKVSVAKRKPTPNVPAAPESLPRKYKFCVTEGENGFFARFRDPNHPQHGAAVEIGECNADENGMMICEVFFGRKYGASWDWSGEWSGGWEGSWGGGGSAGGSGSGSGSGGGQPDDGPTHHPSEDDGPSPRPSPHTQLHQGPLNPPRLPPNKELHQGPLDPSPSDPPIYAPICDDPSADKEPIPQDCCVKLLDDGSAQIVCAGSAYDLLVVQVVTMADINGTPIASIQHPDLPGGGARLPICEPVEEDPEERICCIEEDTGMIVCPRGVDFSLAGQKVPLEYIEFVDDGPSGKRVAQLICGSIENIDPSMRAEDSVLDAMYNICIELGGYKFLVCERGDRPTIPGDRPKIPGDRPSIPGDRPQQPQQPEQPKPEIPRFPDICCYDPSTGTLVCEGTPFHNLPVSVVTQSEINGQIIVSVESERLPGGGARVPLCPPEPEIPTPMPDECCVVESSAGLTLVCEPGDHPYNGLDVTNDAKCFDTPDGRMCAVQFTDENGRVTTIEAPACPPPKEDIPLAPAPDIPPPPDQIVPPSPAPKIPPPKPKPTRPVQECDPETWKKMIQAPKKLTKCNQEWLKMMEIFKKNPGYVRPGRRYSMVMSIARGSAEPGSKRPGRIYGMGIPPESTENSTSPQFTKKRWPGLRVGQRKMPR